jgi:hypothetical protein
VSTVRIVFNGEERVLARGLQVRSLLSAAQADAVARRELRVVDGRGRERGLGGALLDGQELRLEPPARP